MESKNGWKDNSYNTNNSGFSGLPGGYRSTYGGTFNDVGSTGSWWSSTEYGTSNAWHRYLNYGNGNVARNYLGKQSGFSVRCLRD